MNSGLTELNQYWVEFLHPDLNLQNFDTLIKFLHKEYAGYNIYPPANLIFKAFEYFPPEKTKVIILGQDPYHQPGQAQGLAFSVPPGLRLPPSLRNIYKEIESDLGIKMTDKGDLSPWAEQGVLLLNTILSVREGEPGSHAGKGWEQFTDSCIRCLDAEKSPKVFILWGNNARRKKHLILNKKHLILEAPHPSPLSAYQGFFGCQAFSETNKFLLNNGISPIDWKL